MIDFSLFSDGIAGASGDEPHLGAPGGLSNPTPKEGGGRGFEGDAPCVPPPVHHHLLVPLDGSALAERVLPLAVALAEVFSARITLLRVLRTPPQPVDPVQWEIRRTEAHRHLTGLDSQLKARGLESAIEVLEGRPAEQIIGFAKQHQVDLMILSSHGEGGLTGWALSSTIQKVVARTHTSVVIVPAYAIEGGALGALTFKKILLPLDCSPRAECTLPLATQLARAHGAELLLAHVVPEPEIPRRMPPSKEDLALVAQLTERNRAEAEMYLHEVQERLSAEGLRTGVRLLVSPRRARAVCALAEEENVDLVLIAAHGCTGDTGDRYGGIAVRLMQQCGRPVMVAQDLVEVAHAVTAAEEAARSRPGH